METKTIVLRLNERLQDAIINYCHYNQITFTELLQQAIDLILKEHAELLEEENAEDRSEQEVS